MEIHRENAVPPTITGTLMHVNGTHWIAFYLRDGQSCVAEFRNGHAELTDATTWVRLNAGVLRYLHRRRGATPVTAPLTSQTIEEIERVHRQIDASDERIINMPRAVVATIRQLCTGIARRLRSSSAKRTQQLV